MQMKIEFPVPQDKIKEEVEKVLAEIDSRKQEIKALGQVLSVIRQSCKHMWDGPYYACGHNVGYKCKICGAENG